MNKASAGDPDDEPIIQTVAEPLQQYLQKAALSRNPTTNKPGETGANPAAKVRAFLPTHRQPLAMLQILDDGCREQGESIRIRDSRWTIGRDKGDTVIPFDGDISGRHAELRCQRQKGRFRWYLLDRKSTNGTFVRAFRASLSRESELILGGRRYLFQLPEPGAEATETEALQTQAYQAPSRTMLEKFVPRLIEVGVSSEHERTFSVSGKETWIGSDQRCQITVDDDPFISQKHARIYEDETGRWMIEDQKSLNGVWIRIKKFAMDKTTEFQLGQQRFRFHPVVNQDRPGN
ncbi:FHA domain protein [Stieleria maiorica]|uniref:FHA domain protein n=1 Tax=Stieleria maiorica TaxID=2795974 RepID=A0A5B9MQV6_9BACT|nr:FHA domain-containing protein [Stieleria maiorica]QEG02136.1 FHA domain protein [Stieleria maiorica]